ncbi:MAG: tRNA (adenosine(37)-N6)-threonylcarbamoyltransferase complex ATPase subunit type 1 TsaE [Chloroflexi bacterium]|nr:tRNA (adenosine(37)-N6)-threonylcarbamoyltransferase complex ATPase subunit type 1 TsaE [Chloroflexota bacterium]MCI0581175.1 tRNA (adenosine(37)-N6)-threonylcarbamoyltransferase complex ATPase subunit type 1 TsaE [Chloroflexota bacterium]MCI0643456.1 tRNA (adenosine(37)-N6)-threonylcarbamoyltransferase complex ATPase subunit type 1 TsaE [Chloroflexota bacterium]MCI0727454.1 tRNA (adenosine(37)-N6)-threonylcarbamoyltransferase complex ATPase subunit type 1 TsaE [Chloroflexota bacterium]
MAILDEKTLDFISNSPEQTTRLGVRLGELLQANDVVCLSGELGAGKTALAQGIGRGWGAARRVTSPTFTLVNEYPRLHDGCILYHVDCYRLGSAAEVVTAGLDDLFETDSALMIEWPERVEGVLPADRLWIDMRHVSETRRGLRLKATGERSLELLKAFRRSAFGV